MLLKNIKENKHIIISTYVFGILAYLFFFTNLLLNHDTIGIDCETGETISSGRWGLYLYKYIIPPYLMPWFIGVVSLTLISIANYIIIKLYDINDYIMQILISGLIVTFPSFLVMFCYIHTAIPYSFSFLLSILAVLCFKKDQPRHYIISIVLIIFSLSIYQGYLTVLLAFTLILLLHDLSNNKDSLARTWKIGICITIGIITYYVITQILVQLTDEGFNSYAKSQFTSKEPYLVRLCNTFIHYIYFFTHKYHGLINTNLSQVLHILLLLLLSYFFYKNYKIKKNYLFYILLLCYPLTVNIFDILTPLGVYAMMLGGFASIYIFAITTFTNSSQNINIIKRVIIALFLGVILNNIFIANKSSLRLYLSYQNTYSFYTALISNIHYHPEFTVGTKIAIIGYPSEEYTYKFHQFKKDNLYYGGNLIHTYSRENMIKTKLGFNATFVEGKHLMNDSIIREMPIYPYNGSIKKIKDILVVKLSNQISMYE